MKDTCPSCGQPRDLTRKCTFCRDATCYSGVAPVKSLRSYSKLRRCTVTLPPFYAKKLGKSGDFPCQVHGVFQCTDADWSGPIWVVELEDGAIVEAVSDYIKLSPESDKVFPGGTYESTHRD